MPLGIYCQGIECQENVCPSGTARRRRKVWQSAIFIEFEALFQQSGRQKKKKKKKKKTKKLKKKKKRK